MTDYRYALSMRVISFRDTEQIRAMQIWHYTGTGAYQAILESGVFFATDSRYLNDLSEGDFARDSIVARFSDEPQAMHLSDMFRKLDNHPVPNTVWRRPLFVACFCMDAGNRLSQWRGYGRDNGISMGLEFEKLNECVQAAGGELRQVSYDLRTAGEVLQDGAFHAKVQNLSQVFLEGGSHPMGVANREDWIDEVVDLAAAVDREALFIKHPSFEEENEWRAVFELTKENTSMLGFRQGSLGLTPYLSFPLPHHLISFTIVAPGANQILTYNALNMLHRSIMNVGDRVAPPIAVFPSDSPYRGQ